MVLVLLTLGLIAERLAPSGTLHTVGVIDVTVAIICAIFVLLGILVQAVDA